MIWQNSDKHNTENIPALSTTHLGRKLAPLSRIVKRLKILDIKVKLICFKNVGQK